MALYDSVKDLPLAIEGYELEPREKPMGPEFTRYTTTIVLSGGGETGVGEDVIYDGLDHVAMESAGPVLPLAGEWTLASYFEHLDGLDLFPDAPPVRPESRNYRRWAFDSAALDLALRQAGTSLAKAVGREPRPINFAVSRRLGDEDPAGTLQAILDAYPSARFKLDPTEAWTDEVVAALAAHGRVDVTDLKGLYVGTPVDLAPDPELYLRVAEGFPDAWIEDPGLTDQTRPVLEPFADRLSWDAPLHDLEDIDALERQPKAINIKPSRFGPLTTLLSVYEACEERGIGMYGGGQGELGPGRGQIQYLASLFHADGSNDTAPARYNAPELPSGLPDGVMDPPDPNEPGFRLEQPGGEAASPKS